MKFFEVLDQIAHLVKDGVDILATKGGGILIALCIFYSCFFMWNHSQNELFLHLMEISGGSLLGFAGGERRANGVSKTPPSNSAGE